MFNRRELVDFDLHVIASLVLQFIYSTGRNQKDSLWDK